MIGLASCTITIPIQTNLNDQIMLNQPLNIRPEYKLYSEVPDGAIDFIWIQKNGNETVDNTTYRYASETAFKKIWGDYFSSRFNQFAGDQAYIKITLKGLKMKTRALVSQGATLLTGNSKITREAIVEIHAVVDYRGKVYEKQFEVSLSDYNESQMISMGGTYYNLNQTNPTRQAAKLIEGAMNRSIIQFENFLRSIIISEKPDNN